MMTITCPNCGHLHHLMHGIPVARMKCEKCRNAFPTAGRIRGTQEGSSTSPNNELNEFMDKLFFSYQDKALFWRFAYASLIVGWLAGPAYVGFHWAHGRPSNTLQLVLGTFLASLIGAVAGSLAGCLIGLGIVVVRKVVRFLLGLVTLFRYPSPDLYGADYNLRPMLESLPEGTRKVVGWGMSLGIPVTGFGLGAVLAHISGCAIGVYLDASN